MADIKPVKPTETTPPTPQHPLSPRHKVTDDELDALKEKITNANHFEELSKLKTRIIDTMLNY